MFVSYKKLLDVANKNNFAIAAPDVWSIDTIEGSFKVARELNAPIVLMVWDAGSEWIEKIGNVVKLFEKKYPDVVCSLLLDHGSCFESEMTAIRNGFTGVMADRSKLILKDNIEEVRKTVDAAHAVNIAVEAELGHVGEGYEYEETRDSTLTKPEEAIEFVEKTKADALAVAIGTSHGLYKGTPRLDIDLLDELKSKVSIPLVLHGGSGTGDENLAKAVEHGINKVNLCSDLMIGEMEGAKKFYTEKKEKGEDNPFDMFYLGTEEAAQQGFMDVLKRYVKLFKSEGKADLYKEFRSSLEEEYYK